MFTISNYDSYEIISFEEICLKRAWLRFYLGPVTSSSMSQEREAKAIAINFLGTNNCSLAVLPAQLFHRLSS